VKLDLSFPKEKFGPYPVQDGDELRSPVSPEGVPIAIAITSIKAMKQRVDTKRSVVVHTVKRSTRVRDARGLDQATRSHLGGIAVES